MKQLAWKSILVICGGVATFAQDVQPSRALGEGHDRTEFAQLENVWNQANLRGDAEALDRLWADDLEVAVPHMPVFKKAELMAFVRTGRMRFSRYETSDLHIRTYASTAVVTGRLQRKRTLGDHEVEDDWRFTKIYVRGGDGWRVVAFHASEAAKH